MFFSWIVTCLGYCDYGNNNCCVQEINFWFFLWNISFHQLQLHLEYVRQVCVIYFVHFLSYLCISQLRCFWRSFIFRFLFAIFKQQIFFNNIEPHLYILRLGFPYLFFLLVCLLMLSLSLSLSLVLVSTILLWNLN